MKRVPKKALAKKAEVEKKPQKKEHKIKRDLKKLFESIIEDICISFEQTVPAMKASRPRIEAFDPISFVYFLDKDGDIVFQPNGMHGPVQSIEQLLKAYKKTIARLTLMLEQQKGWKVVLFVFVSLARILVRDGDEKRQATGFGFQIKSVGGESRMIFFEVFPKLESPGVYSFSVDRNKIRDTGWKRNGACFESDEKESGFQSTRLIVEDIWDEYNFVRLFEDPRNWKVDEAES